MIIDPTPSHDGHWVLYGRYALDESSDSARVFIIDTQNPCTPRLVGKSIPLHWIDEETFVIYDYTSSNRKLYNINKIEPVKIVEDSTWTNPLQDGKYIAYYNEKPGQEGLWIRAAQDVNDPNLPSPKLVSPFPVSGMFDRNGNYFYDIKNTGELRRISIPLKKEEIINAVFPRLSSSIFADFDLSYDGKEIIYTDAHIDGKLIMIENLFK